MRLIRFTDFRARHVCIFIEVRRSVRDLRPEEYRVQGDQTNLSTTGRKQGLTQTALNSLAVKAVYRAGGRTFTSYSTEPGLVDVPDFIRNTSPG
jgi:hypothetical protein